MLLALLLLAAVSPGRYVLRGEARVDATGLPARVEAVDALALVGPGEEPDAVRLRLMARGFDCDLTGRLRAGGALVLDEGQRCPLEVRQQDARGRIDARLRSGGGRLRGRELALEVVVELEGALRSRIGPPGAEIWTPDVPVRGTVEARAEGGREEPAPARRP